MIKSVRLSQILVILVLILFLFNMQEKSIKFNEILRLAKCKPFQPRCHCDLITSANGF